MANDERGAGERGAAQDSVVEGGGGKFETPDGEAFLQYRPSPSCAPPPAAAARPRRRWTWCTRMPGASAAGSPRASATPPSRTRSATACASSPPAPTSRYGNLCPFLSPEGQISSCPTRTSLAIRRCTILFYKADEPKRSSTSSSM
ncbi:hypothetical protein ZWY2020_042175 [Hordeum vulgare]|nr:hypothetical protein ZWY2020_042175 [Hordeum vulgare]